MKEWRLLDTGSNSAYFNMAVDEAVMRAHRQGIVPPTIRFYQWSPPGLSLGLSQKPDQVVDQQVCQELNVDIVRRLTGGRAIFHDDELTYSLIVSEESGFLSDSILESYKSISSGMVAGLCSLGLEVDLKPLNKNKKKSQGFSAACFDAPSWYEVLANNKKLIGSAQTRRKGVILQHGSIPFTIDADKLYRLLNVSDPKKRNKLKKLFLAKATALDWISEKDLSITEVRQALHRGWEQEFEVKLTKSKLNSQEKEWVDELLENKYTTDKWNLRRDV